LSNRVRDGPWVTILPWCLKRSHEVFHASGGRSVALAGELERVRTLVRACYYDNMTSTEAAVLVGVGSHTTVLRQLGAFRLRARAK
jgi:hypothetical protein